MKKNHGTNLTDPRVKIWFDQFFRYRFLYNIIILSMIEFLSLKVGYETKADTYKSLSKIKVFFSFKNFNRGSTELKGQQECSTPSGTGGVLVG